MATTATLNFRCALGGASAGQVAALMNAAAVPPPLDLLAALGTRIVSDTTTPGSPTVRALVLGLDPVSIATAVANLVPGNKSGSRIDSVMVSSPGAGYIAQPTIKFVGGRPAQQIIGGATVGPKESMIGPPNNNAPANAVAYLKVVSVAVVSGGTLYSAGTTAQLVGGLNPKIGVAGTVSLTIAGGVITGVAVTSAGSGYTTPPEVVITDPVDTGSGGVISLSMGVGLINVLRGGSGYNSPPAVFIIPWFQALFPATGDQAGPLRNMMNSVLSLATSSPVSADEPVLA